MYVEGVMLTIPLAEFESFSCRVDIHEIRRVFNTSVLVYCYFFKATSTILKKKNRKNCSFV